MFDKWRAKLKRAEQDRLQRIADDVVRTFQASHSLADLNAARKHYRTRPDVQGNTVPSVYETLIGYPHHWGSVSYAYEKRRKELLS